MDEMFLEVRQSRPHSVNLESRFEQKEETSDSVQHKCTSKDDWLGLAEEILNTQERACRDLK